MSPSRLRYYSFFRMAWVLRQPIGKCGQKMHSAIAIRKKSTKSEKWRNVDNSRYRCCFASVDVVRATRTAGLNENVSWECLRRFRLQSGRDTASQQHWQGPRRPTVTGLSSGASSLTRTCRRRNEVFRKVARLEAAENSRSGEDADSTNPANPMNSTNPVRIPTNPAAPANRTNPVNPAACESRGIHTQWRASPYSDDARHR